MYEQCYSVEAVLWCWSSAMVWKQCNGMVELAAEIKGKQFSHN